VIGALRLGTRGSQLALWQARTVAALLESRGASVEIVTIRTSGDRLQDRPLTDVGTKRLFVKEIEDAMLGGSIDLAVHSAKDMPAVLPDGLAVAATLPREDPRDALVLRVGVTARDMSSALAQLGDRPAVGTSSIRRSAQLRAIVPHAVFAPVRGNVDTRLKKLDAGEYDALILAAAGMRRLGAAARISAMIPVEVCVPAPGQGIIAIEIRSDDERTRGRVQGIDDPSAGAALTAERALVTALGGGCQLPLGAIARHDGSDLDMRAIVLSPDGATVLRAHGRGPATHPEDLGRRVAADLAAAGALDVLEAARTD
jgi:hydroxymethylbilane synthase